MRTYPLKESSDMRLDPIYGELAASEPVSKVTVAGAGEAWLVTGYDEVRQVLTDPRFSRHEVPDDILTAIVGPSAQRFRSATGMMPPDKHSRLRRLAAKAFTARRVEELRTRAQEMTDSLLTEMAAQPQPADLIEHLALPLPLGIICELLGVPFEDRATFRDWAEMVHSTTAYSPEQVKAANEYIFGYIGKLVAARENEPRDDLLSALVLAREEDDRLTVPEIVHLGVSLLVAGHETTVAELSNSVYFLLTNPDQMRWIHEHPDQAGQAIEELLRYIPLSTLTLPIVATEDVPLGDVVVRAGESVLPVRAAANRDSRAYAEPDQLDFDRPQLPHLTFSHGAHHCIGAALARMELQVALSSLLDRFPGLTLAVGEDDLSWKAGKVIRSLHELPVRW